MNEQFVRDTQKAIQNTPLNQELASGSPRRYDPPKGIGRHNARIHKESKFADDHKNLPFTFRKPPKPNGRFTYIKCNNCGYTTSGTVVTVGIICPECKKFSIVSEVISE